MPSKLRLSISAPADVRYLGRPPVAWAFLDLMRIFATIVLVLLSTCVSGHVLPHMSWLHVERTIQLTPGELRIVHVCRLESEQMKQALSLLDTDGDSTASQRELVSFCMAAARFLADDLLIIDAGGARPARQEVFRMLPGDAGFESELVSALTAGTGELQILDPAYLLPGTHSSSEAKTVVRRSGAPGAPHLGCADTVTSTASTFRTILRLTAPTSGTLNRESNLDQGVRTRL